ncbi:YjcZ family sporulation protein [Rummeliibacillus pycnus]|nr:YjcZ family sporulation protein [Rummeliibacillus pycnus]
MSNCNNGNSGVNSFTLVVVLFILLIIVGATFYSNSSYC